MKRTDVYVDQQELDLIKEAAARRSVPEAEILREAVKLAALGARLWVEPLVQDVETFDLGGRVSSEDNVGGWTSCPGLRSPFFYGADCHRFLNRAGGPLPDTRR